jgi:hypothetical protein
MNVLYSGVQARFKGKYENMYVNCAAHYQKFSLNDTKSTSVEVKRFFF